MKNGSPAVRDGDAAVTLLDQLRYERAATRTDLAVATGLGRGVVAKGVLALVAAGLVEERGTGRSSGGRAPRLLRFRAEAGHLLAVEVGVTSVAVAVADLAGRLLCHTEEPADLTLGAEAILARADERITALLAEYDVPGRLWGIGVGVPGPVEFATGRCIRPPVPGWEGMKVRDHFAERYAVPVWVDNEVNAMALGELRAGAAHGQQTVAFIKVGSRIGGALISGGQLHRGADGGAGEFGHLRISDDPAVVCGCGRVGCVAALAGGDALRRDAERLARAGASPALAELLERGGRLEASDVARAAALGDVASRGLIVEHGRHVGKALAMVVNVFDPSLIVIGGGVAHAGDELLAAIRESIYAHSLPVATRNLTIARTALPGRGGLIGAAIMAADELFSRSRLAL